MKTLAISPNGHLYITSIEEDDQKIINPKIVSSFEIHPYQGLLALAQTKNTESLLVPFIYWRDFALKYLNSFSFNVKSTSFLHFLPIISIFLNINKLPTYLNIKFSKSFLFTVEWFWSWESL